MSMIRRRRRCGLTDSDSSEEDLSNKTRLRSSSTSNAQTVSITNNRKKGGRIPIVTSEEEDEVESSNQVIEYLHVNHRFNNHTAPRNSDERHRLILGVIETGSGKRILKPLDLSLFDSSDNESDSPIGFQRKTKRMRLSSSSSESSVEDEHSGEHKRAVRLNNSVGSENHDRPNTSRNSNHSRTVRNRVRANQRIWRKIENSDSESEVSSEDDIRPRVLQHHSRPVFFSTSSSSDSEDEVSIRKTTKQRSRRTIIYSDDDNSSEQNNSDKDAGICPICLSDFNLQEVGKPSSCDHCFCLGCIERWANNSNTCPIDRREFGSILVFSSLNGVQMQEIPVFNYHLVMTDTDDSWDSQQMVNIQSYSYSSDDQDEIIERCSICMMSNDNHSMIYCDTCFNVYHLQCVQPPLRSYPVGDWICAQCETLWGG